MNTNIRKLIKQTIRHCACLIAAALILPVQAADTLRPADFAQGVSLRTAGQEAFYRIDLPAAVYSSTAWPDMRDVRVFNAKGESLPYSLLRTRDAGGLGMSPPARIALRSFRLSGDPRKEGSAAIRIDQSPQRLSIQLSETATSTGAAEYLLSAPEANTNLPLRNLHLRWADAPANWQVRASVEGSRDLLEWETLASNHPVMDLRNGGERLVQADIPLGSDIEGVQFKYWRLRLTGADAPALTAIEASPGVIEPSTTPVSIDTTASVDKDGNALYALPRPLPVSALRILPAQTNAVLTLALEYRSNAKSPWIPLPGTVAYRLNGEAGEQRSAAVEIRDEPVMHEIRLRAIGAGWGAQAPSVTAERIPHTMIFNARDNGPYLLAWGSRAAANPAALPLKSLVPGADAATPYGITYAALGPEEALGGEERMTSESPADRAQRWQSVLMWLALVAGALSLGVLAFRLWRESQVANAEAKVRATDTASDDA